MAVLLIKPVKRALFDGNIITLHPSGLIGFRKKGRKTEYFVSMSRAFQMAILESLQNAYDSKVKRYNDRKKSGLRSVKPSKPSFQMFSKQIQNIYSIR